MRRVVTPEILDGLAADDPRAVRSRGDLGRINWLTGQARIMAGLLDRHLGRRDAPRLLEIGSGDGRAALRLARRLAPRLPGAHLTLLDLAPATRPGVLDGIRAAGWTAEVVTADAFERLARPGPRLDAVLVNLLLHHFKEDALLRLLARVAARARLIAATEPRRDAPSYLGARLTGLIGANAVTRHDAPASVRAGFAGRELSALWARAGGGRVLDESRRLPFTHAFAALGGGADR